MGMFPSMKGLDSVANAAHVDDRIQKLTCRSSHPTDTVGRVLWGSLHFQDIRASPSNSSAIHLLPPYHDPIQTSSVLHCSDTNSSTARRWRPGVLSSWLDPALLNSRVFSNSTGKSSLKYISSDEQAHLCGNRRKEREVWTFSNLASIFDRSCD